MEDFWMVCSPQGSSPTHRHGMKRDARSQAERLAKANAGREFFVLHAVAVYRKNDVSWTQLSHDIPF